MATVGIREVRKRYGKTDVIHGVSMDIADREFLVLVGPSGCGKTTLLRMIAGLEEIDGGTISIADRVVNDVEPEGPRHRDGVSKLRALSAHDGLRQHGVRVESAGAEGGDQATVSARRRNFWRSTIFSNAIRTSFPEDNANASPSAGPSCATRKCFCLMSPFPTSTRGPASGACRDARLHQRLGDDDLRDARSDPRR